MLKGIAQLGRDSRGAANMFLDQLTKCERRLQEYEGESLETFSDGMMIAVLASSHPPESIRNVGGGRQVQQVEVSGGAPEHPVKHVMAPAQKKGKYGFQGSCVMECNEAGDARRRSEHIWVCCTGDNQSCYSEAAKSGSLCSFVVRRHFTLPCGSLTGLWWRKVTTAEELGFRRKWVKVSFRRNGVFNARTTDVS